MASAVITAIEGLFDLMGFDANLYANVIDADAGSYTFAGQDVTTPLAAFIDAEAGSYLFTGNAIFFMEPQFIKGDSLLVAEAERFIKGETSFERIVFTFIKGNVAFVTFSRFIKGDSALLSIANRYIKGDTEFVFNARFIKGDVSLFSQPPLGELGAAPEPTATGLLSRHYLSIASVKKEVT